MKSNLWAGTSDLMNESGSYAIKCPQVNMNDTKKEKKTKNESGFTTAMVSGSKSGYAIGKPLMSQATKTTKNTYDNPVNIGPKGI